MPATSQQQQKLFGLALAVKRGEVSPSEVSDEVRDIVDRMSEKDIEDFAGTKHAGLPKKVEAQIREMVREIMRERVIAEMSEEPIEEAASRTAMEIGALTGLNKDTVQKFVDTHNMDIEKVYQYVKKSKLTDRLNFVTAIVGTPGNSVQKKMIKMFGESVNEGISVSDERHFGKKGIIIMIDDNGKKVSAIFKDKKNADKYNRNNPSDIKKLLDLAKKTKYPNAIDESVNEEKYPIAIEKFNKELIKHPMVNKAAQHYKKTPAEIVKVLQQRLYTKGDKTGDTKEVWIDFKDTTSGITIKHKMKF